MDQRFVQVAFQAKGKTFLSHDMEDFPKDVRRKIAKGLRLRIILEKEGWSALQ